MPPKKTAAKRVLGPSSDAADPPTPRRKAARVVIGGRTQGPLVRSPAVLAFLEARKTREEIWSGAVPFVRKTRDSDFDSATMYKFATWNVAGLRGLLRKSASALEDLLRREKFDILCLQETKLNLGDPQNATLGCVEGYTFTDHPCRLKKGYSGTRTYIREESMGGAQHVRGMEMDFKDPDAEHGDEEGRILTTWLRAITPGKAPAPLKPTLAVINTYIPNSGMALDRLSYRVDHFDKRFRQYLLDVDAQCARHAGTEPVTGDAHSFAGGFIWTGDLNVAERDYDRYFAGTWKTMQQCAAFTPEERFSFRETLRATRSVDAFRHLYPTAAPAYTFWSERLNGRAKGLGWRIDYFVVSARLVSRVVDCFAMPHILGSDHSPVQLWFRKN